MIFLTIFAPYFSAVLRLNKFFMMNNLKKKKLYVFAIGISLSVCTSRAQIGNNDSTLHDLSLETCVQYALKHYPLVQQALLNEQITEQQIKSRLSDWYPQLNLN